MSVPFPALPAASCCHSTQHFAGIADPTSPTPNASHSLVCGTSTPWLPALTPDLSGPSPPQAAPLPPRALAVHSADTAADSPDRRIHETFLRVPETQADSPPPQSPFIPRRPSGPESTPRRSAGSPCALLHATSPSCYMLLHATCALLHAVRPCVEISCTLGRVYTNLSNTGSK